jgi:hypothetical protein
MIQAFRSFFNSRVALGIVLAGCIPSPIPLKLPFAPFSVSPQAIVELTVIHHDPKLGGTGSVSLKRSDPHQPWELVSLSTSPILLDRQANDISINHLLDTLSSIQLLKPGPSGPLSSMDLDRPRLAVRWSTQTDTQTLYLSSSLPEDHAEGSRVILSLDQKTTWIASGTFFSLVNQIQSWQAFRNPSWTSENADDVEEIWVKKHSAARFYAQRDGDHWADSHHHKIPPLDPTLTPLLTHPWKGVVDEPQQAQALAQWIHQAPDWTVEIKGRMKTPLQLDLRTKNSVLYGVNQARLPAVFILDSQRLEPLKSLKNL